LQGSRVLIAHSSPEVATTLRRYCEIWGLPSSKATCGADALFALQEARGAGEPFGMVLIDSDLSGPEAVEFAKLVKGEPDLQDTALVLLASSPFPGGLEALVNLRFAGYLNAPAIPADLLEVLVAASRQPEVGSLEEMTTPGSRAAWRRQVPLPARRLDCRLPERVLIVEDNPSNRMVASRMLQKLGCESIDEVSDGEQAFRKLQTESYDIVFMDCHMPVMDGYETVRRIRQLEGKRGKVYIVAVTAKVFKGERERCFEAGMDDYVSKPFMVTSLTASLERWAGRNRPLAPDPEELLARTASARRSRGKRTGTARKRPVAEPPPRPANESERILDWGKLLKHLDEDRPLAKDIVQDFLAYAGPNLEELARKVSAGEIEAVAMMAHGFKGSASNIAAGRITKAAGDLEMAARNGSLEDGPELLDSLVEEFHLLEQTIGEMDWERFLEPLVG
jgi:CheY-like chemotaxis protein/HPt (histidine-containing phosphotransfer) domain-containing protein